MPAWMQTADESLLRWLEGLRIQPLDTILSFYTRLGNAGMLFIVTALALILFRKTRRGGVTALTAMGFGLIVTNLTIKPLFSRARPWVVMENFNVLVKSSDPNSFPSGHTCAAFAFAVGLCMSIPWKWGKAAALAAAFMMGFSRLYVGVHFPSDVLVGGIIGTLCGLLAGWAVPKIFTRIKERRERKK